MNNNTSRDINIKLLLSKTCAAEETNDKYQEKTMKTKPRTFVAISLSVISNQPFSSKNTVRVLNVKKIIQK